MWLDVTTFLFCFLIQKLLVFLELFHYPLEPFIFRCYFCLFVFSIVCTKYFNILSFLPELSMSL